MKTNKNLDNTYIIGDVHGCFYTLQNNIYKMTGDAVLIFVVDICDK